MSRTLELRWRAWRVVSLDGSTLDVADEQANALRFGRPGASRGQSAYPKLRFVSVVASGTLAKAALEAGVRFAGHRLLRLVRQKERRWL